MQNVEGYAGSAGTDPHARDTGRCAQGDGLGRFAESGRGGEIRQIGVFENRPEVLARWRR